MEKIVVNFKNYKKLADVEAEFSAGNIYLVKAGNMQGKTSFTQAMQTLLIAKNDNSQITTFGETEGKLSGEFIGADGEKYVVTFEFGNEKDDKFLLVRPDTSTSRKVTDIRNVFQYNAFTVEEFFNWGLSEKGRKEQASVILGLLPKEAREKIKVIDTKINERTGELFLKRTEVNNALKGFMSIADSIVLDAKQEKILANGPAAKEALEKLKIDLAKQAGDPQKMARLINLKQKVVQIPKDITAAKESTTAEAEEIKKQIEALTQQIETLKNKGKAKVSEYNELAKQKTEELEAIKSEIATLKAETGTGDAAATEKLKADIARGEAFMQVYNEVHPKKAQKEDATKKAEEKKKESDTITATIEKHRTERKAIFLKEKLPIDNIYVEEDGLYFMKGNDKLPFTESNISYAEGGLIVAKILCELNKKTPIICIGKAAEYDNASKEKLGKMAEEYHAVMFFDHVTETPEELHFECYTEEEK